MRFLIIHNDIGEKEYRKLKTFLANKGFDYNEASWIFSYTKPELEQIARDILRKEKIPEEEKEKLYKELDGDTIAKELDKTEKTEKVQNYLKIMDIVRNMTKEVVKEKIKSHSQEAQKGNGKWTKKPIMKH